MNSFTNLVPVQALQQRNFLTLKDFAATEIETLLTLAAKLKQDKRDGCEQKHLVGKSIALIFEKNSTRTRVGFELAASDQGAHVTYLGPSGTQIGDKESMKDTARVLGRLYDGIEYRGKNQSDVEILAKFAGVPVFNGLTDQYHPTQILADLLTIREHSKKPFTECSLCYAGDARNNMGHSLLVGSALMGLDFRICAPEKYQPEDHHINTATNIAQRSGGKITVTTDIDEAVSGADFIYTDVWVSMGEPEELWAERIETLRPYQVNAAMMQKTGKSGSKFMHCLPALHGADTKLGKNMAERFSISELEVTDEVFESKQSIVFDQAENRMHTIKALLVATLGRELPLLEG